MTNFRINYVSLTISHYSGKNRLDGSIHLTIEPADLGMQLKISNRLNTRFIEAINDELDIIRREALEQLAESMLPTIEAVPELPPPPAPTPDDSDEIPF